MGSWKELQKLEQSDPYEHIRAPFQDNPHTEEKLLKLESKLSKMGSTEEKGKRRSRTSAGKATEPGNLREQATTFF